MSEGAPLLRVRDLRVSFTSDAGLVRAVDGISFDIREGETVGLVGESGCGKTVTSLAILDLVQKPPGRMETGSSIALAGEELVGVGERRLREIRGNEVAMIFQEPMTSLNPVMTVGAQIAEAIRLHRGIGRAESRAEVIRLLDEVGITAPAERVDSYPHQLSGGMRQRVMIAMALSCEPRLLIADEPTTALDVTIQAQILGLLAELRDRHGMAVLLITHDLGVVAQVCDRVLVMYAGQIVEEAGVEELFDDPRHPYTRGLLDSLPGRGSGEAGGARAARRLRPIPGTVPSPLAWPTGCRFHDRCSYAWERCVADAPELEEAAPEHQSRCWLVREPARDIAPPGDIDPGLHPAALPGALPRAHPNGPLDPGAQP